MVNFLCQLGKAMVPRYLIKNRPKRSCEGFFVLEEVNI